MSQSEQKYGLIASFKDTPELYHAAEKVRDAGYKRWDTYSSFPVHGMPEAQGQPRSKVPIFTFCGGITLPIDLDILRPFSSTVKPWVSTAL